MALKLSWQQALAWRTERHLLDPVTDVSVEDVVRRLCGVQAQVASSAELAIRVRQSKSKPGDVGQALAEGRLIKTWAMRGTLHLLTPGDAGNFLSLMAAGRWWETPRWERYFGVSPRQMEALRPIVGEILGEQALTREELVAVGAQGRSRYGGLVQGEW